MKKKIILIGAGGHAESCIDVIKKNKKYQIAGLIGTKSEVGKSILGHKVIGSDKDLKFLSGKIKYAIITVGQIKTAEKRKKIYNLLRTLNFKLPVIISPLAYVSKFSKIGDGTIVMHFALINSKTQIGNNCIINSKALIEHGTSIGNHCHVSTSATINSGVTINDEVFIGSSSCIKQNLKIGTGSLIAMGSRILKNVPKGKIKF